ncbi:MAG: GNAT family N-acetyltransferase [bacterium]
MTENGKNTEIQKQFPVQKIETKRMIIMTMPVVFIDKLIVNDDTAYSDYNIVQTNEWLKNEFHEIISKIREGMTEEKEASGFDAWIFIDKTDRTIIGDGGFKGEPDAEGRIDIGYGIVASRRGNGYGFEAVSALIEWGFKQKKVKVITADCNLDNTASQNLLDKIGMKRVRSDETLTFFELKKNQYKGEPYNSIWFRRLTEVDLKLMTQWLSADFVNEWYKMDDTSFEKVSAKYLPRINGEEPTECYIAMHFDKPIGFLQTYFIKDYPDYNKYVQADDKTAGADIFIGEEEYIHKGWGTAILRKFIDEVIFCKENIDSCIMGPDPENVTAIKTYEKLGFKYLRTIRNFEEGSDEYLMELKNPKSKIYSSQEM